MSFESWKIRESSSALSLELNHHSSTRKNIERRRVNREEFHHLSLPCCFARMCIFSRLKNSLYKKIIRSHGAIYTALTWTEKKKRKMGNRYRATESFLVVHTHTHTYTQMYRERERVHIAWSLGEESWVMRLLALVNEFIPLSWVQSSAAARRQLRS